MAVSSPSLLGVNSGHLTKHYSGVTIHEGNAGKTLALAKLVNNHWLLRLEHSFGSIVSLEGDGTLGLLATSVLAHLPVDLDKTARSTATSDVSNGRVPDLDVPRNVKDLHLSGEVLGDLNGLIGLAGVDTLVVHLHSENLASACSGGSVGGQEFDFLTGLDFALLHTSSEHITDTLDLADTGQRQAHLFVWVTLCRLHEVVEAVLESVDVHALSLGDLDILALPPAHLVGLAEQVVAIPARDREDWGTLLDERLWPADLDERELHLITDLLVPGLLVAGQGL